MQALPDYAHLTRDELMRLSSCRNELTDVAQIALDAEISGRRISSAEIASFQDELLAAQDEEDRKIDSLVISYGYFGKKFFGKKNRAHDPRFRVEEYDTTLWFSALWFPIFPIASYRIKRLFHRPWSICRSDVFHVLNKFPRRDWEQILVTWIKAVLVLLFLRFAVPFAVHHFVY